MVSSSTGHGFLDPVNVVVDAGENVRMSETAWNSVRYDTDKFVLVNERTTAVTLKFKKKSCIQLQYDHSTDP